MVGGETPETPETDETPETAEFNLEDCLAVSLAVSPCRDTLPLSPSRAMSRCNTRRAKDLRSAVSATVSLTVSVFALLSRCLTP